MQNQEKIELLEAYKLKEKFILDDWEDREVDYPSESVLALMNKEVIRFTNYLIFRLKKNTEKLQSEVQEFYDNWDNEDFTNDQTEFIVETQFEAMRIAGVKIDELLI
jgi:valyl-tRNA synthetase